MYKKNKNKKNNLGSSRIFRHPTFWMSKYKKLDVDIYSGYFIFHHTHIFLEISKISHKAERMNLPLLYIWNDALCQGVKLIWAKSKSWMSSKFCGRRYWLNPLTNCKNINSWPTLHSMNTSWNKIILNIISHWCYVVVYR